MGPIDYTSGLTPADPAGAFTSGFKNGFGINQAQQQEQAQQSQMQAQKMLQMDLADAAANPTTDKIKSLSIKYPQLSENLKRSFDMIAPDEKQQKLSQSIPIHAAMLAGRPDIASQQLTQMGDAYKNAGMQDRADNFYNMAKEATENPNYFTYKTGAILSAAMGHDDYGKTFGGVAEVKKGQADATKAQYEAVNTPERFQLENSTSKANIRNLDSQIQNRAEQMNLDRDKLQSDVQLRLYELNQKNGELPEGTMNQVNGFITDSAASQRSSENLNSLADKIDSANLDGGITAKGFELVKKITGSQNEISKLRSEYSGLTTQAALAAYKKVATGSTSDRDIDTAMVGVPSDTASPEVMSSYLRGMAKLQQFDSILGNAKAEWASQNKYLGAAKKDINVDGIQVPKGTTFKDFSDQYLQQKYDEQIKQRRIQKDQNIGNPHSGIDLSSRSYMSFA